MSTPLFCSLSKHDRGAVYQVSLPLRKDLPAVQSTCSPFRKARLAQRRQTVPCILDALIFCCACTLSEG